MKSDTVDGLYDTLEDLRKQLEKAEEKYQTLARRTNAVEDAIAVLQQAGMEPDTPSAE